MVLGNRRELPGLRDRHHHSHFFHSSEADKRSTTETTQKMISTRLLPGLDEHALVVMKRLLEFDGTARPSMSQLLAVLDDYRGWLEQQCPEDHVLAAVGKTS